MKCPYCDKEMLEGEIQSQKVPVWVKKGDKEGKMLPVKKHFIYNETEAYYCKECKKLIISANL